jgi:PTH1 family peptidyl-tRNA hydrolase
VSNEVKLIVGLGNPGPDYADTRHNAGAFFVAEIARQYNCPLQLETKFFGHSAKFSLNNKDIRLLIPSTFMNLSGQAIAAIANFYKIAAENILVAHDELDLPPGTLKLKQGGGHGGHNGLRDTISKLANNKGFLRLRIGIGHPGHASKVTGYVLKKAPIVEFQQIEDTITEAVKWLPEICSGDRNDWAKAMNHLHSFTA